MRLNTGAIDIESYDCICCCSGPSDLVNTLASKSGQCLSDKCNNSVLQTWQKNERRSEQEKSSGVCGALECSPAANSNTKLT